MLSENTTKSSIIYHLASDQDSKESNASVIADTDSSSIIKRKSSHGKSTEERNSRSQRSHPQDARSEQVVPKKVSSPSILALPASLPRPSDTLRLRSPHPTKRPHPLPQPLHSGIFTVHIGVTCTSAKFHDSTASAFAIAPADVSDTVCGYSADSSSFP